MIASRTLLLILTGTSFTCCECFTSTNSYKYTYNGIDTGTMNHSPSACQAYKENPFQNTMAFAAAVSVYAASLLAVPNAAIASLDDSNNNYRITECKDSKAACVSTASVKNLKYFTSPWTFDVSSEEALARIKGLLQDAPGVTIDGTDTLSVVSDGDNSEGEKPQTSKSYYVHATTRGDYVFEGEGSIEFLINPPPDNNNIVTFKATGYGASKQFFDSLRKQSNGVFISSSGMNEEMEDALLGGSGTKGGGNGVFGQLKAFYGYQSGQGFEDVLLDEDN